MAPSSFVWRWREEVDRRIARDPEYTKVLHRTLTRLNQQGEPRAALDDVVSQRWRDSRRDWYDAAAQFEIGQYLQLGWYIVVLVPLPAEPGRDKDAVGNQTKLDRLPVPYAARCAAGAGDNDGRLEWRELIRVAHRMQDDELIVLDYQPTEVPLEIGYTDPETTLWHLWEAGGLARWPYGHSAITLLLTTCMPRRGCIPPGRPQVVAGHRLVEPEPKH